jgi:hypothetical protein
VAYIVSQAIELETGTAAADYILLHRGDAKLLLENLNYIRMAAGRILDGILEDRSLPSYGQLSNRPRQTRKSPGAEVSVQVCSHSEVFALYARRPRPLMIVP